MPKALIIGFWSGDGTASQIMGHERIVKQSLLATAPAGTTADIAIVTGNSIIDGQPDLFARLSGVGLSNFFEANQPTQNWDVVVVSYTKVLSKDLAKIAETFGVTVFSAMPNSGDYSGIYGIVRNCGGQDSNRILNRAGINIFCIGGGDVNGAVSGFGNVNTGHVQALNRPLSQRNVTSWTTGAGAGVFLQYINSALTQVQARKALITEASNYPNWDSQNGHGFLSFNPNHEPISVNFGVIGVSYYPSSCDSIRLFWIPYLDENPDTYRVYINNSIHYTGLGLDGSNGADSGTMSSNLLRYYDIKFNEIKDYTIRVVAVYDGQEQDVGFQNTTSYTPDFILPPPEPEPEPIPEPEPEPPYAPALLALSGSRVGNMITLNIDTPTPLATIQRRTPLTPFETIATTSGLSYTDIVPFLAETYIYRVANTNGVVIGEFSELLYIAGIRTSALGYPQFL